MKCIVSSRFYRVLVCGIIALFAAFMNFMETGRMSWGTGLMVISAILIFMAAGMMYRSAKE